MNLHKFALLFLLSLAFLGGCLSAPDPTGDDDSLVGDDDDSSTPSPDPSPTPEPTPTEEPTPSPDVDGDNDGFTPAQGDCDDTNPAVNPMATDVVGDGYDQNCDGVDGFDGDGDGHASEGSGGDDCDDSDPNRSPSMLEVCGNAIDENCDGSTTWLDQDMDGERDVSCGGRDCDDLNPAIHSGVLEDNSNGIDDNCNGVVDQFAVEMEWTPGITRQDVEDGLVQVVLTVRLFDVNDGSGHNNGFQLRDSATGERGDTPGSFYPGPDAVLELGPGLGLSYNWGAMAGPTSTQTYRLRLNQTCYVWGEDPDYYDPTGTTCLRQDPTTF